MKTYEPMKTYEKSNRIQYKSYKILGESQTFASGVFFSTKTTGSSKATWGEVRILGSGGFFPSNLFFSKQNKKPNKNTLEIIQNNVNHRFSLVFIWFYMELYIKIYKIYKNI